MRAPKQSLSVNSSGTHEDEAPSGPSSLMPSGLMVLDLQLLRTRVRVFFHSQSVRDLARVYFSPAIRICSARSAVAGEIVVEESGVWVKQGPKVRVRNDLPLFLQLEAVLVRWCERLNTESQLFHAGCFVYDGVPVVLAANSGGGKSSITLAGIRAGAKYLSDDLTLFGDGKLSGLARSIQFESVLRSDVGRTDYLKMMDLTSYHYQSRGSEYIVPIYHEGLDVVSEFELQSRPVVVVQVRRGCQELRELSELERVTLLHESTIAHTAEYNGSLGVGPSYELSWEDPASAFCLLEKELSKLS